MDGWLLLFVSLAWVLAGVKSSAMLLALRAVLYAAAFIAPSWALAVKANEQRKWRRKAGKPAQTTAAGAAGAVPLEEPEADDQCADNLQRLTVQLEHSSCPSINSCSPAAAEAVSAAAEAAADSAPEEAEADNQCADNFQTFDVQQEHSACPSISCCSPAGAEAVGAAAEAAADSPLASLVSLQDWGAHAFAVVDCSASSPTCSSSNSKSRECSPPEVSSSAPLDAPVTFPASCQPAATSSLGGSLDSKSRECYPLELSSSASLNTPVAFPASCEPAATSSLGGSLDSAGWRVLLHPAGLQQNTAACLGSSLDSAAWRTLLHATGCQRPSLSGDDAAAAGPSGAGAAEHLLQDRPPLSVCTSSRQLSACQRNGSWKLAGAGGLAPSAVGCDAMPLPSPADSPLARRVTNERDEHGFPTSPALLELLQQRAAAEASANGWGDGSEQQHAPWISVQLRAVPQQLSDEHSSADGAAAAGTSPPWLPLLIRHISYDARNSSSDSGSRRSELQHSKSTAAASGKAAAAADAAVTAAEAAAHNNRVAQLAALHSAAAAAAAAGSARRDQRLARLQETAAGLSV